jgi:RND superfamily putative drug exporter
VAAVIKRLRDVPHVKDIDNPYAKGNEGQISKDGHSAIVNFEIAGSDEKVDDYVTKALASVAAVQKDNPNLRVEEFGGASADKALSKAFSDDFKRAEITSLPITILILIVAFGALVAASVPLLLAITAVAAAIGLIGPISHLWAVDESIGSVVLLIGLAVGVDYSMFYLRREREERAAGNSEEASLEAAAATSGRAVLISGLTVMIAMGGMYLAGAPTFLSFATGTILVVAIAMVGSLTVLPAVLSKLGDRVNKGRIPFLRPERRTGEPRVWSWILDRVLRRPVVSAAAATAVLVVLAIPAFGLHTANTGVDGLPHNLPIMKTYDRIQAAFPGGQLPANVVVRGDDVTSKESQAAIAGFRSQLEKSKLFGQPVSVNVNPDKTVAVIDVPFAGSGTDDLSNRALASMRDDVLPATLQKSDSLSVVGVTGMTAGSKDFNDLIKSHVPYVFAFVFGLAFVLLLVTFRSIVIPIKAIVLNLLSVGAAYGVVVWIFQKGHLESLLGFRSTGAITSWLPLFLFVILFGLSMDYHVFILSRIREAFDRGESTEDAISHGIKSTASVVTAAAIVMVAVFAIFATLSAVDFKQFGVGLAVAILVDATIVRGVLLPSVMKLLGDWNWYLPRWMRWLPQVSPDTHRRARPEAEPARA